MGMSPFLIGDGLKILLAAGLFPLLWSQLVKRGLAPRNEDDAVIDLTDGTTTSVADESDTSAKTD
jgi:hypothetical protein